MRHCLVVDDSSVIRKVARRILEDFDFTVTEAEDGAAALDACRHRMPDLILLDWHLPVMDGIEFLKRLRELEAAQPKVVFCTSEADVAQIAKALRAGADEYILKPFDRGSVEAKLHEVGML
jgi:two-component system chemotaxis response regulator CheY